MTTTSTHPPETTSTPESENLARLRLMLDDPAERDHWPDIERAIAYLVGDTFVKDLAA